MARDSIQSLADSYRRGEASPVRVTKERLERIDRLNPELNCFITILEDGALRGARESEERFRSKTPLGPLDGVPIAVKDIIYIEGVRCTAGSKILAQNVAGYDAPVIRRLKASGAILIGTTNLHEFAAGVTSSNPHYGPVRNPWDLSKVAGGSSGGSAAAVASGLAAGALGTDTAGSVRIPAALCGTVGLKPTYGLVSRLGVVPLAPSLDTVGVLASSSWDAAAMLEAIAGHEPEDMTTIPSETKRYAAAIQGDVRGMKVGVPRSFFGPLVDPKVEAEFDRALGRLQAAGCEVEDAALDVLEDVYQVWLPIRRAEATAFHLKWLKASPELYGEDVRKLLELGKDVLAVDYVSALNARPGMMEMLASEMRDIDALALPTTCVPAPGIGDSTVDVGGRKVEVYRALNSLTLPFNYLGSPAVSVPSGLVGGLPVGVQLVGKVFDEVSCLRLGRALEEESGGWAPPPSAANA